MYLSFEQLVLLLLLAFILFGPEKLPQYAEKLGRLVAKLRQATQEMSQQVQTPLYSPPASPPPPPLIPGEVTCPQCHRGLESAFAFCPYCGQRLPEGLGTPPPRRHYGSEAPVAANPHLVKEGEIRLLTEADAERIFEVINDAARAYQGAIPDDCWKEPYMPLEELQAEMAAGVRFWGFAADGQIVGVMGRQDLNRVTLIRHAYVQRTAQGQGVGTQLLAHLRQGVSQPLLVGTWAAAWWAVRFYQKHGFQLVPPEEKDRLLKTYWTVSDRQIETSVVLADEAWFNMDHRP